MFRLVGRAKFWPALGCASLLPVFFPIAEAILVG